MVVYQGIIANHDAKNFEGQIEIDENTGIITKVVPLTDKITNAPDTIFDDNCIIFPGMGDIHIHAREDDTGLQNYKEEYATAGDAALNGGVTYVAAMPNTPNPLTTQKNFDWHRKRITQIAHPVSILNYVGISTNTKPIGVAGEHPYKAFFGKSVGTLTLYDEKELESALKLYPGHNVSFHVEYEPFIEASISGKTHSDRRPVRAVNHGLKLLLPLIEKFKLHAKLCHWSIGGESFAMIKEHRERAKGENLPYTTIEVSPLHLLFDTSMTDDDPSLWLKIQMNPAIQGPEHRKALIEGLRSGFIDYIATDHAPHTKEEKYVAFAKYKEKFPGLSNEEIAEKLMRTQPELFNDTCCENGMSGAPWLDTFAPVVTLLMKEHDFSAQDIARVTAYNPGKFVNQFLANQFAGVEFGKGFGKIEEDYVGSLTIINMNKPTTIDEKNLKTKVGWSPLSGRTFPGKLEKVVIRGKEHT